MRKQQRSLPSVDPRDPGYRRLRYCRYADDTLLGFTGPKAEAEQIRQRLAQFLREDLKLELNPDKTLITHARTQAADSSDTRSPSSTARHGPQSTAASRCVSPRQ